MQSIRIAKVETAGVEAAEEAGTGSLSGVWVVDCRPDFPAHLDGNAPRVITVCCKYLVLCSSSGTVRPALSPYAAEMNHWLRRCTAALFVIGSLAVGQLMTPSTPAIYTADACAEAGGQHVDVSGCTDVSSDLEA